MKERIIAYDYIRIVAMVLVVACHCFGDVSNTSSVVISLLSYLEAPCNGLFFAVSGALLLPINSHPTTRTYANTKGFITKRLRKVAIPTILWSIVYLALNGNLNLVSVCSIPFSAQGASVLWFMYVMVGMYLVAPIISPWLEKIDKKTLELYLGLWLISLCFPILKNWLIIDESVDGVLFNFSGYVGYFVLGYYLKKYGIQLKLSLLLYVIAFVIMIFVKLFVGDVKLYDGLWYLSVFCAVSMVFYWNMLEKISSHIKLSECETRSLGTISNLIFGVYFIHYGIIEYLIPHVGFISKMPYLVGYAIRIIIVFCGALILCYMISYLPLANYVIGYKHKIQE
ncbi:Surface polysaccharide O-acyltransferase, integral membrane enzyme [Xylanibacter ruminicola]|uniref:Surface polysaccharide O-acyltransferase, integral membrane enzyme n=1 Tax=Xylanibacter ruminicola TaxID=839 RepID=A0A1H4DSB7_XYLRU|nr:acyltransferase family protein [Xylanibacter ruminicola]SEA75300.1 Surface polysaccharide O-acyltransferase, integral membrane enzyme [Xylanibacter ruminicola]